jgi:hypothetical protein
VIQLAKDQHKVRFLAKKPTDVEVSFKTRDGKRVEFDAVKDEPQIVSFFARNRRKK